MHGSHVIWTAAALLIGTGCRLYVPPPGIDLRSESRFDYEWGRYTELSGFKSFALAGDPEATHVSGVAYAYPFPSMAIDAAIDITPASSADANNEAN